MRSCRNLHQNGLCTWKSKQFYSFILTCLFEVKFGFYFDFVRANFMLIWRKYSFCLWLVRGVYVRVCKRVVLADKTAKRKQKSSSFSECIKHLRRNKRKKENKALKKIAAKHKNNNKKNRTKHVVCVYVCPSRLVFVCALVCVYLFKFLFLAATKTKPSGEMDVCCKFKMVTFFSLSHFFSVWMCLI